jgi:hypothetical protein
MAKVKWMPGIEYVSGALCKSGKNHAHPTTLLATHRTAETTSSDCNRIYLRDYIRSTPVRDEELARRERFGTIAQMVNDRKQDPSKVMQDQVDFIAQKDQVDGKKTMRTYLWSICTQEYDKSN